MWCFCWLRCALFTAGFLPFWVGHLTCPSSLMLLAGSSESQRVDSWWIFIFLGVEGMNFLWTGISQSGLILYVLLRRLIKEGAFVKFFFFLFFVPQLQSYSHPPAPVAAQLMSLPAPPPTVRAGLTFSLTHASFYHPIAFWCPRIPNLPAPPDWEKRKSVRSKYW